MLQMLEKSLIQSLPASLKVTKGNARGRKGDLQVYSKDPECAQGFLSSPEVINWKQHLQIQSR